MASQNFKKERGRGLPAQAGFIRAIILVVGALVLLKYVFDIDVIGSLTQGRFKELWSKLYELGLKGWEKYGHVVIKAWDYLWGVVKNLLDKIK